MSNRNIRNFLYEFLTFQSQKFSGFFLKENFWYSQNVRTVSAEINSHLSIHKGPDTLLYQVHLKGLPKKCVAFNTETQMILRWNVCFLVPPSVVSGMKEAQGKLTGDVFKRGHTGDELWGATGLHRGCKGYTSSRRPAS